MVHRRAAPNGPGADRPGEPAALRLSLAVRPEDLRGRRAPRRARSGEDLQTGVVPRSRLGAHTRSGGHNRTRRFGSAQTGERRLGSPAGRREPPDDWRQAPRRPLRRCVRVASRSTTNRCWLDVTAGPFLRFHRFRSGRLSGAGTFAKLTVTAAAATRAAPPVAVRAVRPAGPGCRGARFDQGWQEPSTAPRRRSWRGERPATLTLRGGGGDVTLRIAGESPLRYFPGLPPVGGRRGGDGGFRSASSDFTVDVRIPAALLVKGEGRVTLTADQTFVPGDRDGTADTTAPLPRIYSVTSTSQRLAAAGDTRQLDDRARGNR